ncbi:GATA zinc finger domain-containing protein 3 [Smittium mucronatum]|uniref:GATA zinc finger domain-containing protein 3 n=1 Tax=Smittium mucronatum TaxID=133383 RepID=A0A1R0GSL0_9FUNG|nr:GATA zinc finger domain-containing protein 3 [Smittium mucronatum]
MISRFFSPEPTLPDPQCFWAFLRSPDLNFCLVPDTFPKTSALQSSFSLYSLIHPKDSIQASSDIAKLITNKSFASIKLSCRIKHPFEYSFEDNIYSRRASTPNTPTNISHESSRVLRKLSLPQTNNLCPSSLIKPPTQQLKPSRLTQIIEDDHKFHSKKPLDTNYTNYTVSYLTFYLISHDLFFVIFHFEPSSRGPCHCTLTELSNVDLKNIDRLSHESSLSKNESFLDTNLIYDSSNSIDFNFRHLQIFSKSCLSFLAAIPSLSFELMTQFSPEKFIFQKTSFSDMYTLNSPKNILSVNTGNDGGTLIDSIFLQNDKSYNPLDIIAFSLGKHLFIYIQCASNSPYMNSISKSPLSIKRIDSFFTEKCQHLNQNYHIREGFSLSKYKLNRPYSTHADHSKDSSASPIKISFETNKNPVNDLNRANMLPNLSAIVSHVQNSNPSRRSSSYDLIHEDASLSRRSSQPEVFESLRNNYLSPNYSHCTQNQRQFIMGENRLSKNNSIPSDENHDFSQKQPHYKFSSIDRNRYINAYPYEINKKSNFQPVQTLFSPSRNFDNKISIPIDNLEDNLYSRGFGSVISNSQYNDSYSRRYTLPSPISNPVNKLMKSKLRLNQCISCGTTNSPEWRKGPQGQKTLCNACGLRYSRSIKKKKKRNA